LRFCGANDVQVCLREADNWFVAVHLGPLGSRVGERRVLSRETGPGRAIADGKNRPLEGRTEAGSRRIRGSAQVGEVVGVQLGTVRADDARRRRGRRYIAQAPANRFVQRRQVALLESFAAQAVIAIENVRLFTELRDSLERLKAAQANLMQSEKMASLGQLTAGIATRSRTR
jgi:hypothetical protein